MAPTESPVKTRWLIHLCWGLFSLLSMVISSGLAFVLGGVLGEQQLYNSWTERKLDKLATILESGPFEGVDTGYSSAAQVYLTGTLPDPATRDSLHQQLISSFGTEEADFMIWQVELRTE